MSKLIDLCPGDKQRVGHLIRLISEERQRSAQLEAQLADTKRKCAKCVKLLRLYQLRAMEENEQVERVQTGDRAAARSSSLRASQQLQLLLARSSSSRRKETEHEPKCSRPADEQLRNSRSGSKKNLDASCAAARRRDADEVGSPTRSSSSSPRRYPLHQLRPKKAKTSTAAAGEDEDPCFHRNNRTTGSPCRGSSSSSFFRESVLAHSTLRPAQLSLLRRFMDRQQRGRRADAAQHSGTKTRERNNDSPAQHAAPPPPEKAYNTADHRGRSDGTEKSEESETTGSSDRQRKQRHVVSTSETAHQEFSRTQDECKLEDEDQEPPSASVDDATWTCTATADVVSTAPMPVGSGFYDVSMFDLIDEIEEELEFDGHDTSAPAVFEEHQHEQQVDALLASQVAVDPRESSFAKIEVQLQTLETHLGLLEKRANGNAPPAVGVGRCAASPEQDITISCRPDPSVVEESRLLLQAPPLPTPMVLDGSQDWFDQSDACYNLDVTVEPRAPVEDVVSSFAAGTTTDWKSMLHSCLQDREAMLDGRALDLSMSGGNKINAAEPITAPSGAWAATAAAPAPCSAGRDQEVLVSSVPEVQQKKRTTGLHQMPRASPPATTAKARQKSAAARRRRPRWTSPTSVKHEHAPMFGEGQLERDEKKTPRLRHSTWRENLRAVPVDTRRRGVHQQQELDDDVDELIALIN